MDQIADLQAQVIALRTAVEGAWLSLLVSAGPNARADADALKGGNLAALQGLTAATPDAQAMKDAVIRHTDQLWTNVAAQLPAPLA